MPHKYWSFSFATAVYLINRLPNSAINFEILFQKLLVEQPNFTKLRVFGYLCYTWLRPNSSHMLDARYVPCVFMGYSLTQSAYFCLDPTTSRVYVS